jgi:MOSC domain-containing protein YiiM
VLVYQAESYRHWRCHLGRHDLEYRTFGKNFTFDGLPDLIGEANSTSPNHE